MNCPYCNKESQMTFYAVLEKNEQIAICKDCYYNTYKKGK
jgi:transcription elongation factor Elf1